MGLLDKLGEAAFGAVDVGLRAVEVVQERLGIRSERPPEQPVPAPRPRPVAAVPFPSAAIPVQAARLGKTEVPAQVYGGGSCPWTGRALRLLRDRGAEHEHVDLDDTALSGLRPYLEAETKQHTEPFVYLRGSFIGGYNALDEIDRLGQLDEMLLSAEERARRRPSGGVRIVAPRRPGDISPDRPPEE